MIDIKLCKIILAHKNLKKAFFTIFDIFEKDNLTHFVRDKLEKNSANNFIFLFLPSLSFFFSRCIKNAKTLCQSRASVPKGWCTLVKRFSCSLYLSLSIYWQFSSNLLRTHAQTLLFNHRNTQTHTHAHTNKEKSEQII